MKILGWSNKADGIHHYRIREPLRGLATLGHTTEITQLVTGNMLDDYDVLLVRGLHTPGNSQLWRYAATIPHLLCVYDLDDDIWAFDPTLKSGQYWANATRRRFVEENIQAAHLVTTPSEHLAAILRQLNPNVAVIPNTIPRRLLALQKPTRRHSRFIIGWQGAYQHLHDIGKIYMPIFRFMLRHPDVDLHLWGPDGFGDLPTLLRSRVYCHGWVNSVWSHYYRLDMDIALAPLDYSDPFNETRSDIRVREYGALGIPTIASAGPVYGDTIQDGFTGILAHDLDDWTEALEFLYASPLTRERMGGAARARAQYWTTEREASEIGAIYERESDRRAANREAARAAAEPST